MTIEITTSNILFGLVVIGIVFIAAGWAMLEADARRQQAAQQRMLEMQKLAAMHAQSDDSTDAGGCVFVLLGVTLMVYIGFALFGF